MKIFRTFIFVFIFYSNLFPQIGPTIPPSRRVDWTKAGYNRNASNIPTSYAYIYDMPGASTNAETNSNNIQAALSYADTKNEFGLVCIQFDTGTYNINSRIALGNCCFSNIVIKGYGPELTTINYVGTPTNAVIRVAGYISSNSESVLSYNSSNNSITIGSNSLQIGANDFIVIKAAGNGPWEDINNDYAHGWPGGYAHDYLGQIVKVTAVNGNTLTLQDNIALTWSIIGNYSPYVKKFSSNSSGTAPVPYNIGIEDLKITSNGAVSKLDAHIIFENVANCWVKNVASIEPYRSHIYINQSAFIEVRYSHFVSADSIGVGGYGYGINIDGTSTYNLIEDNIFEHLRHSVLIHLGANRNVVGYNYSREEYSGVICPDGEICPNGDFQLHGHYPYANLFEGNRGDYFKADNYWGPNGPYNTFIRNYSYYHDFIVQQTDNMNILANEFLLSVTGSSYLIDKYGTEGLIAKSSLQKPPPASYKHTQYTSNLENSAYLSDISYYKTSRPSFIPSSDFTWPPMGPPLSTLGGLTTQNIPARQRYCVTGSCSPNRIPKSNEINSLQAPNRYELSQNFPNPFNPATIIKYSIPEKSYVSIKIYDILGKEIETLVNEVKQQGLYSIQFNGDKLSSGAYIYKITAGKFHSERKMILLK